MGNASLNYVMICDTEEEKMGDGNVVSFQKLVRSNKVGVTKPFKTPITCNDDRVHTKKTSRPTYFTGSRWNVLPPGNITHLTLPASQGLKHTPEQLAAANTAAIK